MSIDNIDNILLTPKQVQDKFSTQWAESNIQEYEYCTDSQILAWGYREGYEEARKDLINSINKEHENKKNKKTKK